ncbi:MAG: hypothetical protein RL701_2681 [Pseudomonadota bacterium]|jgi:hypothetical protein
MSTATTWSAALRVPVTRTRQRVREQAAVALLLLRVEAEPLVTAQQTPWISSTRCSDPVVYWPAAAPVVLAVVVFQAPGLRA